MDTGLSTKLLTDAQETEIAEVRNLYASKIAEHRILEESALKPVFERGEA